jgi:ferredoxin
MIVNLRKPIEEILDSLQGDDTVLIVNCGGCPEGCGSGTPEELKKLQEELAEGGKEVTGPVRVDFLCNKALIARRLSARLDEINGADCLLIVSCGLGVQAAGAAVDKPVRPAMDTISLGGFQGLWPSDERCEECGECVLAWTGGICPRTQCTKSLLNGQCGGALDDGSCEISRQRPCGWRKIYERMEELGQLDRLQRFAPLPDYFKLKGAPERRTLTWWALENPEG